MQDKTEGEIFMQNLRTPSAGSDLPLPGLSRIRASPARHLWHYFFHFWPLVQTLGRGPSVGSPWSSSTPLSLGRSRVAPPPTPPLIFISSTSVQKILYPWARRHGIVIGNLAQIKIILQKIIILSVERSQYDLWFFIMILFLKEGKIEKKTCSNFGNHDFSFF